MRKLNVDVNFISDEKKSRETTTICLKKKLQDEWLVPQIVTKLIEAGQDECRNTLEKSNKNLQNINMKKLCIVTDFRHFTLVGAII